METTSFLKQIKYMKNITVAAIVVSALVSILFTFLYVGEKTNKEESIYIVTDAGTFLVKRNEYNLRQKFEVENQVRDFVQLFFENDQYSFKSNVNNALNLIDEANGKYMYDTYRNIYDLYVQSNAHSKVVIDSIKVNMNFTKGGENQNERKYQVKLYLQNTIYYSDESTIVPLAFVFQVSEHNRSEKNPFGLLITGIKGLQYNPIIEQKTPTEAAVDTQTLQPTE